MSEKARNRIAIRLAETATLLSRGFLAFTCIFPPSVYTEGMDFFRSTPKRRPQRRRSHCSVPLELEALEMRLPMAIVIGQPAPNFTLVDVNAASPRSGQTISPRDYLQQVSGWYFGHAT